MTGIGLSLVRNFACANEIVKKFETALELLGSFCLSLLHQQKKGDTTIISRGETMKFFSRLNANPQVLEYLSLSSIGKLFVPE